MAAHGADLSESIVNVADELSCAVCYELIKEPTFFSTHDMSCWHSFCFQCATELKQKRCPICNAEFLAIGKNIFASRIIDRLNEQRLLAREREKVSLQIQEELDSAKNALLETKTEISSVNRRLDKEISDHSQTKHKHEKLASQVEVTQVALSQSKSECDTLKAQVSTLVRKLSDSSRLMDEELQLKDTQMERLRKMNEEEVRRHDEEMKNSLRDLTEKHRVQEEGWKKQELALVEELAKLKQQNVELLTKLDELQRSQSNIASEHYLSLRKMCVESLHFSRFLYDKVDATPDPVEHHFNQWHDTYTAYTRSLSSSFFFGFKGSSSSLRVGDLYLDSKSSANIAWEPLGFVSVNTGTSFKSASIVKNSTVLEVCAKRVPKTRNLLSVFREAHILWRCRHPFILRLEGMGSLADSEFSLVFAKCRHYLESALVSRWDMSDNIVRPIFYGVLSALKYLHKHDVVHRCVSTFSVLIAENELSVKLAGFAHSRSLHSLPFHHTYDYITRDSVAMFHPAEMRFFAPELTYYSDEKIPLTWQGWKAADVWAVACVFGEMLQATPNLLVPPSQPRPVESLNEIVKYSELMPAKGQEEVLAMFPMLQAAVRGGEAGRVMLVKKMENEYKSAKKQSFTPLRNAGVDLMLKMLRIFPHERISVEEALLHPYFASYRHPIDRSEDFFVSPQEKKEFSDDYLLKFCKTNFADVEG